MVPKTIVGIIYIITPILFGTLAANIPTIIMDIKIEINVAIPVDIMVYDAISIDFSSFVAMISLKTKFWSLPIVHQ